MAVATEDTIAPGALPRLSGLGPREQNGQRIPKTPQSKQVARRRQRMLLTVAPLVCALLDVRAAASLRVDAPRAAIRLLDVHVGATSIKDLADDISAAHAVLFAYDRGHRASAAAPGSEGLGGGSTATAWAQQQARPPLADAARTLCGATDQRGRVMLGICAQDAGEGVAALKSWVTSLNLPRGVLHGMDKDGEPLDMSTFGSVYIKYNSLATAKDAGGTAVLSGYAGDFRGVYLNVDLNDGVFRQFAVLPLDLFDNAPIAAPQPRASPQPPPAASVDVADHERADHVVLRSTEAVVMTPAVPTVPSRFASSGARFASRALDAAHRADAFVTLHRQGWVVLPQRLPPLDEATLHAIVHGTKFEPIFNGHAPGEEPLRFMGTNGGWQPTLEWAFTAALGSAGLLACSDGSTKVVNDCYALRSLACADDEHVAEALGRQPAHSDSPAAAEGKPQLAELHDADVPLSVLLAIMPGTKLWVFPSGCDSPDEAFVVHLDVGQLMVWRGDLVHAGAGYAHEHVRVHSYADPPACYYERPTGKTNLCPRQPEGWEEQVI